ncbi:MAG TPA: hypothetical protein VGL77_12255 [Armatimonadota bacterium]|jgi:hypothetical protein
MQRYLIIALTATLILGGLAVSAAKASDAEEQRQVAEKFLIAYFRQDMKTARQCLPVNDEYLFAQYPFNGTPKLSEPKVHENQALVEFNGSSIDGKFLGKGGILFRQRKGVWYVRQVLFYTKIPRLFGLPSHSVTDVDRAHEPKVKALAERFVECWKSNNTAGMFVNWFDWPHENPRLVSGLTLSEFTCTNYTTYWKDPFINYSVKATYHYGILSYSMTMHGGLVLMKEGENWKVRGNQLIFDF